MALGDALLLPEDDLALATVLRSPLFGFEDDDLFAVAWNCDRSSLRAALRRKAPEQQLFADAVARLDKLAQIARRETPFTFYALLLGAGGMRNRILGDWARRPTTPSTSSLTSPSNTSGDKRRHFRVS